MKTFKTVEEIRAERQTQRGNKVVYNLLGVLLGELDRRPNQNTPITEGDIYKTIKKLYESAIECQNVEEQEYLQDFIKKQLNSIELNLIIENAIRNGDIKNFGDAMKYMHINYPDQYDGKVVSGIVRKLLS